MSTLGLCKQRLWMVSLLILSTPCLAEAPVPEPITDVETEVVSGFPERKSQPDPTTAVGPPGQQHPDPNTRAAFSGLPGGIWSVRPRSALGTCSHGPERSARVLPASRCTQTACGRAIVILQQTKPAIRSRPSARLVRRSAGVLCCGAQKTPRLWASV